jgi:hypothetical protein
MMKHKLANKVFLLFLVLTLNLSIGLAAFAPILSQQVEALAHDLVVIDRTRIRMTRAFASESDWEAAIGKYPRINDVFASRNAFNSELSVYFRNKDFRDSNIWDSNENYTYRVPDSDCTSEINDFDPGEDLVHVKLVFPNPEGTPQDGNECFELNTGKDADSVPLGDHQEVIKAFGWDDAATIRTYQADKTGFGGFNLFKRDANDVTKFWRADEAENDLCRDFLQLIGTGTGVLHILTKPDSTIACVTEDPWHVPDGSSDHGPMNIRIGQVSNQQIPEGEGEASQEDEEAAGIQVEPSCESENSIVILGWLLCGFINALDNGIQGLASIAENLLDINSQNIRNNDELRAVWSYFRAIATFLLLAVGLAMVISQAIGS